MTLLPGQNCVSQHHRGCIAFILGNCSCSLGMHPAVAGVVQFCFFFFCFCSCICSICGEFHIISRVTSIRKVSRNLIMQLVWSFSLQPGCRKLNSPFRPSKQRIPRIVLCRKWAGVTTYRRPDNHFTIKIPDKCTQMFSVSTIYVCM